MRRHLRLLGASAVAALLTASIGGYFAYRAHSQESAVVVVNGQGIPPALYEKAQTQAAVLQQRAPGYFLHYGDINRLITQILIDQEETHRGIACTAQDGLSVIATQIALAPETPEGLAVLLRNADLLDAAPPGYTLTPEGQRTPSTVDAVATWASNSNVRQFYTEQCTTARLYNAVTPPNATNDQRNAAINTLLAQLRANAHIISSGSVPVNTPTPPPDTPTPLPTTTAASTQPAAVATSTP